MDYVSSVIKRQRVRNLNQLRNHELMQLAQALEPEKTDKFIRTIADELANMERKRMNAEHETHKLMTVLEMTKHENVELQDTNRLEKQGTFVLKWAFFCSLLANLSFTYLIFFA